MEVKPGQSLILKVESVSHQGEGVAKLNGHTVFVPYGAPGDLVQGEIISVKKEYARALIREVLVPGQRVEPQCPWFYQCGGCNLQHLDYRLQLAIKSETVRTTLKKIGGIDPGLVREVLPTRSWNYRNKLQASVGLHQDRLTAGLYRPRSHDLVPVDECHIQHGVNNRFAAEIAALARDTGITPWDEEKNTGILRHIMVRHSERTGETLAVCVVSRLRFPNRDQFLARLRDRLSAVNTLVLNENPRSTNVILGEREEIIWGPGYITDEISGLKFKISAGSFWQVNPDGAEKVYRQVKEYAQLTGRETVLDVYCGTGSIGLFLAQEAGEVNGIESNAGAVKDARDNAVLNKAENAKFYTGKAEDLLPQLVKAGLKAEVIILDPPRKGCAPALLEGVVKVGPERIVYVSCNPATLARDLKTLGEKGYLALEVQPVDMFPQTNHVETIVLMSRVKE